MAANPLYWHDPQDVVFDEVPITTVESISYVENIEGTSSYRVDGLAGPTLATAGGVSSCEVSITVRDQSQFEAHIGKSGSLSFKAAGECGDDLTTVTIVGVCSLKASGIGFGRGEVGTYTLVGMAASADGTESPLSFT